MDRETYYIEISCSSVEEAKKRALVLAYLTYDLREHNFVRLSSAGMMVNPYNQKKMYDILDKFNIELIDKTDELDLKALTAMQQKQAHCGLICSEKDIGEMRFHERYKTLRLNDRFLHITVATEEEEKLMDREHIQLETRLELENTQGPKGTMAGLTFMD